MFKISRRTLPYSAVALMTLATAILPRTAEADSSAQPIILAPFKNDLYEIKPYDGKLRRCDAAINKRTLKLPSMDGRHTIFDFNELRDVNGRDVPMANGKWQNVSKPQYITLLDDRDQREFNLRVTTGRGTRTLESNEVGNPNGAKFAVVFIHGAAGIYANRELGMNDDTFSGNFNRLKNLVVQNGGVYYTPTIKDFDKAGPEEVTALIEHIAAKSQPGAPIVLTCASSGGSVCAGVAKVDAAAKNLAGIVVMGASWSHDFLISPAHKYRVPVVFAQGTCDRGNPYDRLFSVFAAILKRDDTYPTKFFGFADGVHGTPIRMIDWRETLNWIFSVDAATAKESGK